MGWGEGNWESCWGRCKPSTYKVAIRGKAALCEARGTSVPITAAHKRLEGRGRGGERKTMVSNMSRASPDTTGWIAWPNLRLSAVLVISIWKKARQEFTHRVTRGLERESDLRAHRSWKPMHSRPSLKHLSAGGLFSGTWCTVASYRQQCSSGLWMVWRKREHLPSFLLNVLGIVHWGNVPRGPGLHIKKLFRTTDKFCFKDF